MDGENDHIRGYPGDIAERVLSQSADPLLFMDATGTIARWNRGAELLFGWTPEEAVGSEIDILFPDDYGAIAGASGLEATDDDAVVALNHEAVLKTKAGALVPVKITITVVRDGSGEIVGSAVGVRDVTREKKLESELRWRIGELTLLEDVVRAAEQTLDLDRILRVILTTVTAGSGLGFNRAFLFLLGDKGLECRLAIGASSWDEARRLWPEHEHVPDLETLLAEVLDEEHHEPTAVSAIATSWVISPDDDDNILVRCLSDEESRVWPACGMEAGDVVDRLESPEFAVVPMVHGGAGIGVVLADNVVTRRAVDEHAVRLLGLLANEASSAVTNARLFGEVVQHARNLEAANEQITRQQQYVLQIQRRAALGDIAAAISHEVRAPLVSIGGFARSILRDIPEESPHREMLDIIVTQVARMEHVVQGLATLADLPLPNIVRVDSVELIESAFSLHMAEAEPRGIRLLMETGEDARVLWVDEDQWRQVLVNLISNGIAATPNGGAVTVTTVRLEDGWTVVSVSDTGHGVPEEKITSVFSPLFSNRPTGKGLGLKIASLIVNRHHGRMSVDSAPGKGTTIHAHLPPEADVKRLIAEDHRSNDTRAGLEALDPQTVAALRAR